MTKTVFKAKFSLFRHLRLQLDDKTLLKLFTEKDIRMFRQLMSKPIDDLQRIRTSAWYAVRQSR